MIGAEQKWLVPLNKKMENPSGKVVFFPHAGGSAYSFAKFSKLVTNHQLYAVELPGTGTRLNEQPFNEFVDLIDELSYHLKKNLTLPTVFLGHSMGALIAFECARELERKSGFLLSSLMVSGHAAPMLKDKIKYLDPDVDDDQLIKQLRMLEGMTEEVLKYPEFLELILKNVRADCRLIESYQYQKTKLLSCPITCIVANKDKIATQDQYEKWAKETSSEFKTITIEGGHFALFENTQLLSEAILSVF